jgi:hypothetical protein
MLLIKEHLLYIVNECLNYSLYIIIIVDRFLVYAEIKKKKNCGSSNKELP